MIGNRPEMNEFLRTVPDGRRAILEITILEPNATADHQKYFRAVVVTGFVRGFRTLGDLMTRRQVEELILGTCPITEGRELHQISGRELHELIDWCNYYAAVNLGIELNAEIPEL